MIIKSPSEAKKKVYCSECGHQMGVVIGLYPFSKEGILKQIKETKEYREGKREPLGYRCVNPKCKNRKLHKE